MNKISEKKVKELIKELKELSSLKDSKRKSRYWYNKKQIIVNSENIPTDLIKEFLDEYNRVKVNKIEAVETDDRAVTNIERDEEGNIQYYTFEIFRRDTVPLSGKLDRKEMETLYRLYSIYGSNLTQKIVSREFPMYTFVEFKRILRAFNIYKSNSEFPPHMIEEHTEEELVNLHNQNKENNLLRRLEKDQLAEANRLINKLAQENLEYKNFVKSIENISVNINGDYTYNTNFSPKLSDTSIIIHLSDLHIGAKCESNTLYPNKWDREEIERRLDSLANKIHEFGHLDTLIINLLGDNLDGMDNQTARRDHYMPQNMDNMEQVTTFIEVMTSFILKVKDAANIVKIYSVKDGNHDGITGYVATLALLNVVRNLAPEIDYMLFKDFIGKYTFKDHTYLICHGK